MGNIASGEFDRLISVRNRSNAAPSNTPTFRDSQYLATSTVMEVDHAF